MLHPSDFRTGCTGRATQSFRGDAPVNRGGTAPAHVGRRVQRPDEPARRTRPTGEALPSTRYRGHDMDIVIDLQTISDGNQVTVRFSYGRESFAEVLDLDVAFELVSREVAP